MKRFTIAALIFLLSALSNAAERKIAYEPGENISVANVDGTHTKKIAEGALPEISPESVTD